MKNEKLCVAVSLSRMNFDHEKKARDSYEWGEGEEKNFYCRFMTTMKLNLVRRGTELDGWC